MRKITDAEEQRLINATERAIKYANEGLTPTAAVIKAAQEENYGPDHGKNMAHMFNQSKHHAEFAANPLNKRSHVFDTADSEKIAAALAVVPKPKQANLSYHVAARKFPTSETEGMAKAASIPEKFAEKFPMLGKLAAGIDIHQDRSVFLLRDAMTRKRASLVEGLSAHKEAAKSAGLRVESSLQKAATYFLYGQVPFEDAETRYRYAKGPGAEKIASTVFDLYKGAAEHFDRMNLHRRAPVQKRGSDSSRFMHVDLKVEPYCHFEQVKTASDQYVARTFQATKIGAEIDALDAEWKEFMKLAGIGGLALMQTMNKGLESLISDNDLADKPSIQRNADNVLQTIQMLDNPALQRDLGAIHARSRLAALQAEDPVLARFSQDEVLQAFNELRQIAPKAVSNPTLQRAALRQYLESASDPASRVLPLFESGQLVDVDAKLTDAHPEPSKQLKISV